ncbi:hypothetical protein AJ79_00584 [Helicocarpus griseus UAMH5409]|uniref:Cutinase n=1 Tax=Helicocarpus griseus UAMH5409 TaxID=1447875 RepID=A0A2B7YAF9_9EURO|nr:hypothetical protein AJ79_00584 [Helicocarpus griseus UAMH5409]
MCSTVYLLSLGLLSTVSTVLAQPGTSWCPPVHLVFARDTNEPPQGVEGATPAEFVRAADKFWSRGYGAAGYSTLTNLTALIPSDGAVVAADGYPVQYPANGSGCSSEEVGTDDMVNRVMNMAFACPDTKFAIGGHGEGGIATIRAISALPPEDLEKVIAVIMFGSSGCPDEVRDRCRSYCNAGDTACEDSPPVPVCQTERRATTDTAEIIARPAETKERRNSEQKILTCDGPDPPERGHEVGTGLDPHTAYHQDGFYVEAAACYIFNRWRVSSEDSFG